MKIITLESDQGLLLKIKSNFCSLPLSSDDIAAIDLMKSTLDQLIDQAIGIAAVQIGYPKQIFVLRINDKYEVFVNPSVDYASPQKTFKKEACLSIPGFLALVKRPKKICINYFDENGSPLRKEFEGILAQAVCHEMDHLNGVLLTNRMEEQIEKNERVNAERKKSKEKRKSSRRK